MMQTLPRWMKRVAALALLAILGELTYAGAVLPLKAAYDETHARLAEQRELLQRYRAVASQRQDLRRQLDRLKRRQADSGLFISGKTDALAAAALQDRISDIAEDSGGDVRSMQSLEPKTENGLTRVGMDVQIVADIRALKDLLYEIETGRPLLFVRELEIRGRMQRTEDNDTVITPDLLIKLSVAGFRLGGTS